MSRNVKDFPAASGKKLHPIESFTEVFGKADFTDSGTTGTKQMAGTIPKGAVFLAAEVKVPVAFSGDTSAVVIIGDGTDTDRYNTGTPSVFAAATEGIAVGVPSGAKVHTAAIQPTITVTSAADFTNVAAAAQMIVTMYYIRP